MKKNNFLKIAALSIEIIGTCTLTGCASCKRFFKNMDSEWGDGLHRTVDVYDVNGDKIKEYSGKFDITFDKNTRRIIFDDENGKRHIIFPGTSTVVIDEE